MASLGIDILRSELLRQGNSQWQQARGELRRFLRESAPRRILFLDVNGHIVSHDDCARCGLLILKNDGSEVRVDRDWVERALRQSGLNVLPEG